ncbi:hypothetical protein K488DRAFT_84228 [Vararia minispora EC-137]|uniref:Uncharacterized protein n=1 Tax=Vararia minispora EC-137 TaxID=1314806 RepID=A0ACB8QQX9_9AGAM|nr:hypothetical protein K488DRAFT_84228 [Vararia minispora EC-137]
MFHSKSLSKFARRMQANKMDKRTPGSEDGHVSEAGTSVPGLSTVAEEDGWSDFEEVSLDEVDEEPKADRGGGIDSELARDASTSLSQPPAVDAPDAAPDTAPAPTDSLRDPFATPSDYWRRSPASSLRPGSASSAVNPTTPLDRVRHSSKASRRSRRSSGHRNTLGTDLRLLLDFPLPPKSIPTPQSSVRSRQAAQELTPIADDRSVFYDSDPFRAESLRTEALFGPEFATEYLASNRALSTIESSARESFHTAQSVVSRRSTPPPPETAASSPPLPPSPPLSSSPPSLPPKDKPPRATSPAPRSLPPRRLPGLEPSSLHKRTPSSASHSTTFSKATASLRRFSSFTRDTLRSSFQPRPKKRAQDAPAESATNPNANRKSRYELPELGRESFHISIPSFKDGLLEKTQGLDQELVNDLQSAQPYPRSKPATSRHGRFKSAPSLLVTPIATEPRFVFPVTESPPLEPVANHPPRPTRPAPPIPPELSPLPLDPPPFAKFTRVDPRELSVSPTADPRLSSAAVSFVPPSPSWLSRNVIDLEEWFNGSDGKLLTPGLSNSSHESLVSSDSFYSNRVEPSDSEDDVSTIDNRTPPLSSPPSPTFPAPSTVPPASRPVLLPSRRLAPPTSAASSSPSETLSVRGYVDIHDGLTARSTRTKLTIDTNLSGFPLGRVPPREYRIYSPPLSLCSRTPVSTKLASSRARTRSRSNSVTRATITHYRRSVVESRIRTGTSSRTDSTRRTGPKSKQSSGSSRTLRIPIGTGPTTLYEGPASTYAHSSPTVSLLPPLDLVSVTDVNGAYASSSFSSSSPSTTAPPIRRRYPPRGPRPDFH